MENNKLKVAIINHPPFIMESEGKYTGFEIELWEALSKELGLSFEYEKHDSFKELFPIIASKKADIAFAGVTINEKREEIVDFSHSIFDSGLRILLSKNRKNIDFVGSVKSFFVQGYKHLIKPLFVLLVIVLVFANILWFAEKGNEVFSPVYLIGIFQAAWLSFTSIIGTDGSLRLFEAQTWLGRTILALAQITNLAVLGLLIGELTAFITTRKIRLNISGPQDL